MDQSPGHRASKVSTVAGIAAQALIGLVGGPLFVVGVYRVAGLGFEAFGDWVMGDWFSMLFPIAAAAAVAALLHWKARRFRVFAWTLFASSVMFHLWFGFVVVASFAGPDF